MRLNPLVPTWLNPFQTNIAVQYRNVNVLFRVD
jgi:hypothetical protein